MAHHCALAPLSLDAYACLKGLPFGPGSRALISFELQHPLFSLVLGRDKSALAATSARRHSLLRFLFLFGGVNGAGRALRRALPWHRRAKSVPRPLAHALRLEASVVLNATRHFAAASLPLVQKSLAEARATAAAAPAAAWRWPAASDLEPEACAGPLL